MSVRRAVTAGQFYPAEPEALRQAVHYLMPPQAPDAVAATMALLPHAGYVYSGAILGETLSKIRLPDTLILLGNNHTGRGLTLAVWPDGQWLTPLGPVPVDAALAARLIATQANFIPDTTAHMGEHSLEVLLPFLQVYNPKVRIVPVAVGFGNAESLREAGTALGELIRTVTAEGQDVAMIVSSDMHHFGNQQTTLALDTLALDALLELDPDKLLRTVLNNSISMCGVFPATLSLHACKVLGADRAVLVRHATSADVTGDTSRVVGYAGVYVYGASPQNP